MIQKEEKSQRQVTKSNLELYQQQAQVGRNVTINEHNKTEAIRSKGNKTVVIWK